MKTWRFRSRLHEMQTVRISHGTETQKLRVDGVMPRRNGNGLSRTSQQYDRSERCSVHRSVSNEMLLSPRVKMSRQTQRVEKCK